MRPYLTPLFIFAWGAFCASAVFADPLPGENLVFQQQAMEQTNVLGQTYFGHDELSTAVDQLVLAPITLYRGAFMADDFAVKSSEPITHVRWWGSYLNNQFGGNVQKFFITFEQDVPQGPNNPFSRPGTPLLNQIVTKGVLAPGSGTFVEGPLAIPVPPAGEALFVYNAELAAPFVPTPNTVYWLKIVALTEPTLMQPNPLEPKFQWGWHNRDYTLVDSFAPTAPAVVPGEFVQASLPNRTAIWHFQDDAVSGALTLTDFLIPSPGRFDVAQTEMAPRNYVSPADGPTEISQLSKDLAFELYAVPEPATVFLAAACTITAVLIMRRRR